MLKKLLGKKKDDSESSNSELIEKISKMNLTEMRAYVRDKVVALPLSEEGLYEVMKKLVEENPTTKHRYLQNDDMDTKKKKAFDLVVYVSTSKRLTIATVELIQKFIEAYEDIITDYDKRNKDIYKARLEEAIAKGIGVMESISKMRKRMNILGE